MPPRFSLAQRLLATLSRYSSGGLARNTFYATFWQVVRLFLQFAYLILLTRSLGSTGYGSFSGLVALSASLSPLAGLGFGTIIVKNVSRREDSFPDYWGKSLFALCISSPILIIVVLILNSVIFHHLYPVWIVLSIACSELIMVPLIYNCTYVYQAKEHLGLAVLIHVILSFFRLTALSVLSYMSVDFVKFETVVLSHLMATSVSAILILLFTYSRCGKITFHFKGFIENIWEGFSYSSVHVLAMAHAEMDKTITLKLSSSNAAGLYSAANRVVSATTLLVNAYILSVVPRLFREGEKGFVWGYRKTVRLLLPVCIYGVLAGVCLFFGSSLITWVIGKDFEKSAEVIRWLSCMPLLYGFSSFMLALLTCSNLQWIRFWIEGVCFCVNLILNIICIPLYGVAGPVLSLIASQTTICIIIGTIFVLSHKR